MKLLRSTAMAVAVVMVVGGAGCDENAGEDTLSSDSSDPVGAAGECAPGDFPVMCANWSISGGAEISGRSGGPIATFNGFEMKCEEWAAGVDLTDDGMLELGSSFAPVGGQDVGLSSGIADYEGPGEYDLAALEGIDGSPFAIIAGDLAYQADEGSTGSLTIDASGSGTLVFDGFIDTGTPEPAEPGIVGAVSWTCIDPT